MRGIEIAYIGGSYSGKACALACMCDELAQGISVEVDGRRVQLFLQPKDPAEDFAWGAKTLREGHVLPQCLFFDIREYTLRQDQNVICPVGIMDYMGGMLTRDDNMDEFDHLLSHVLRTSPVLTYVIPGNILALDWQMGWMEDHHKTGEITYRKMENWVSAEIGLLKSVMNRVQSLRTDHPPLLLFATKSDLIPQRAQAPEALLRLVRRHNLLFPGTEILGCGATLGKNIRFDNNSVPSRIASGYAPEGFAVPLLLTVGRHLLTECRKISMEILRDMQNSSHFRTGRILALAFGLSYQPYFRELKRSVSQRVQDIPAWNHLQAVRACLQESTIPLLYLSEKGEQKNPGDFLRFQFPDMAFL